MGNDLLGREPKSGHRWGNHPENISFILCPGDKQPLIGQNDIQTTAPIPGLPHGKIDRMKEKSSGSYHQPFLLPKDNKRRLCRWGIHPRLVSSICCQRGRWQHLPSRFQWAMPFSGDEVNKPVNVLSGGEKVRVSFQNWCCSSPMSLILDDPTNHLIWNLSLVSMMA